jgi:hypothetical protein
VIYEQFPLGSFEENSFSRTIHRISKHPPLIQHPFSAILSAVVLKNWHISLLSFVYMLLLLSDVPIASFFSSSPLSGLMASG